ncbi:Glyoxalase/Bleomycin resistance protein/Dihydroxybiphenyl dioxygenase [Podospora conica]|nr:Glyoxalase/Bleomycin resistance protein/Dihydroxybiphenyl dioxygenase [Schizothecium conicum]
MSDWKPPKTGCPVWIEITSTDMARSHKFYSTVFNWTWKNPEVLDTPSRPEDNKPVMVDFNPDVNISGGISLAHHPSSDKFAPRPGRGGVVISWLVGDVEATAKVIEEAGGKMMSEARDEGGHGVYRYFEDVDGNLGSIYQFILK